MTQDNGGPAFPITFYWDAPNSERNGMTLRDYFAAKAMQSWLSGVDYPSIEQCAGFSYKMADAMLEARKQPVSK